MRKSIFSFVLLILLFGCTHPETTPVTREEAIPQLAVKISPADDRHPPLLHSSEYEQPIPLPVISTAGAEDSPFIPAGREELYFFFTPDATIPPEKQLLDGVTGIWFSEHKDGFWQEPRRVILQDPGKLSLDGCAFVEGKTIFFCTAREGYAGLHWARAEREGDFWKNWRVEDFPAEYEVGELHLWQDELYYHSAKAGGKGGTDIWMLRLAGGEWRDPQNIEAVNTAGDEGMPYLTPDGQELWFNRFYQGSPAVFRSQRITGEWQQPELIISQFAGEPTLDKEGNIYFVHHYYYEGKMLEADIYVAKKK